MSFWNVEGRVEKLKKLWAEGNSAQEIADMFGDGCTRNMVISKKHRLKLPARWEDRGMGATSRRKRGGQAPKIPPKPKRVREPKALSPVQQMFQVAPVVIVEDAPIPLSERKQLVDLGDQDCRWPIGDPLHAGFHFCGKKKVTGLSYCERHVLRAYQPPPGLNRKAAGGHLRVVGGIDAQKENASQEQTSKDMEAVE